MGSLYAAGRGGARDYAISVTNLVAVPEDKWQTAVRQFTVLKRLLEVDGIERTRAAVEKVAKILKKYPATIYKERR